MIHNNSQNKIPKDKLSHFFQKLHRCCLFVCFVVVLCLFVVQSTSNGGTKMFQKSNCVMINDPLYVFVQRRWHNGNPKVWQTNLRTDIWHGSTKPYWCCVFWPLDFVLFTLVIGDACSTTFQHGKGTPPEKKNVFFQALPKWPLPHHAPTPPPPHFGELVHLQK